MGEVFDTSACNEYKSRNILSLNDRMKVIRAYDSSSTRLSYQSLATKFNCSPQQIKNILLMREDILKAYLESDEGKDSFKDAMQKRQEKIKFLGKVMYEYIQRMMYNNYYIDEHKVRDKALEIKDCIAIENFQVCNKWFQHFQKTYGITGFDRVSLRNNVQIFEVKKTQISAIDMIKYVSHQEQQTPIRDNVKPKHDRTSNFDWMQRKQNDSYRMMEPAVVYKPSNSQKNYSDEGYYTGHNDNVSNSSSSSSRNDSQKPLQQPLRYSNETASTLSVTSQQTYTAQKRKHSDISYPDIETPQEALKHLKVLEEYAMLQDNYRAIGLLTQLEKIYKEECKNTN